MLRSWIHTEQHLGDPIRAGKHIVTPYSRATTITIPGLPAGFVWNRPAGVLVKDAEGEEHALSIPDFTRRSQLLLYALGLLGTLMAWIALRPSERSKPVEGAE